MQIKQNKQQHKTLVAAKRLHSSLQLRQRQNNGMEYKTIKLKNSMNEWNHTMQLRDPRHGQKTGKTSPPNT